MNRNHASWRLLRAALLAILAGALAVAPVSGQPAIELVNGDYQQMVEKKNKIKQGDPEAVKEYQGLLARADRALEQAIVTVVDKTTTPPSGDKRDYLSLAPYWWPDPQQPDGLPYIRRDGRVNPKTRGAHVDYDAKERFFNHASVLSTAAFYSDDPKYARRALDWLEAWFMNPETRMNPNLNYGQGVPGLNNGRPVGIIEFSGIGGVITGIQLLRAIDAIPEPTDRAIDTWFEEYLNWLQTSEIGIIEDEHPNNHGTWYDVQVAGIMLFLGRREAARELLENVKTKRIATQIEPDGRQPHELARTKSFSYSKMNLRAFQRLVDLGKKAEVDLWSYETPDGRSIRKAEEFLEPFVKGEKKWEYPQL
jgi:hypothetical protein